MDFSSDSDVEPDLSRSWVTVDREAFALEDSMVAADSMFLVKREDKQSLVPGEKFVAKAHALMADNLRQDVYEDGTRGTLFLTNYRVLFATFEPSVSSGGKSRIGRTDSQRPSPFRAPTHVCTVHAAGMWMSKSPHSAARHARGRPTYSLSAWGSRVQYQTRLPWPGKPLGNRVGAARWWCGKSLRSSAAAIYT